MTRFAPAAAAAASLLLLCAAQAATAQTNSSSPLSQLQLNPTIQRATDAAKSKAGAALAAAETVPTAAEVVASEALSLAGLGYPNNVNSSCIKSSFEYVQAFDAAQIRCVSPCLFGRFPDSAADPVWKSNMPLPPKNASEFIKGEKVTLAFVTPSSGLENILKIRADCTGCSDGKITALILKEVLGIDPEDFGLVAGDKLPFKVFGDDCSLFERTSTRVKVSYPTFPDAFDRITRTFKLDPKIFGEDTLRPLQEAYSYNNPTVLAQFKQVTQCSVNVTGDGNDAPNCESAITMGTGSIPAGSGPKCAVYVTALQAFCNPQGLPNYDSPQCVSTLKTLAAKTPDGQAGSVVARAFFAACFDFLAAFNTDNSMVTDTAVQGGLAGREYLVSGDALLKQAGGYFIKWLQI